MLVKCWLLFSIKFYDILFLQIKFAASDVQTIRKIIDEVTNFEVISGQNPSLVQYFGVEVHRVSE